jgi:hypothetical protein
MAIINVELIILGSSPSVKETILGAIYTKCLLGEPISALLSS